MLKATIMLCIITLTVYLIDTFAYSLKLVIYRNKQYSLTGATFNIVSFFSKFALMFQAPLLGMLIDINIRANTFPEKDFRLIILCASLGVIIAIILLPSFINIFTKVVDYTSKEGSLIKTGIKVVKPESIKVIRRLIRKPKFLEALKILDLGKYKWILLLNLLVTGIHTIGILSSYYGALYLPEARLSIAGFSGSINSIASIVLIFLIEPRVSMICDSVYKGKENYEELKLLVMILVMSKFLGTIIAQILFIPGSKWVVLVYKILVGMEI